MEEFNEEQIDKAMKEIEGMDHFEMCHLWRNAPAGSEIYFRSDLPTGEAFKDRLFQHFGGFTPQISRELGF